MFRSVILTSEEIHLLTTCMEVYRMQGLRGAEAERFKSLQQKLKDALSNEWDDVGMSVGLVTPGDGWVEFDSSNLKAGRYHPSARRLDIEFHSGATWHYLDVPSDVWEGLQEAESKGRYFRAEILDLFVAVPEADPAEEPGE